MQLRAKWILICFVIESTQWTAKTYKKFSFVGIFSRLGPFSQVFGRVM